MLEFFDSSVCISQEDPRPLREDSLLMWEDSLPRGLWGGFPINVGGFLTDVGGFIAHGLMGRGFPINVGGFLPKNSLSMLESALLMWEVSLSTWEGSLSMCLDLEKLLLLFA